MRRVILVADVTLELRCCLRSCSIRFDSADKEVLRSTVYKENVAALHSAQPSDKRWALRNFGPGHNYDSGRPPDRGNTRCSTHRALVSEAWTKTEHVARWWDPKRCSARGLRNRSAAGRSLSMGEPLT